MLKNCAILVDYQICTSRNNSTPCPCTCATSYSSCLSVPVCPGVQQQEPKNLGSIRCWPASLDDLSLWSWPLVRHLRPAHCYPKCQYCTSTPLCMMHRIRPSPTTCCTSMLPSGLLCGSPQVEDQPDHPIPPHGPYPIVEEDVSAVSGQATSTWTD